MAEYKGLTIRIGGDTSQLNSALKASTKTAAALDSQIRQITRAMRFDPGDFGNINTRLKLSENRMEALYSKLTLVRNGYKELGKQIVTVGGNATSVKELAKATENVELSAKAADKRYEDVTASLAAMYREFEKLGTASIKQALNMDNVSPEIEAIIAKFRELGIISKEAGKDMERVKLDLSDAGRVADIDELLTDMRTLGAITDEQIASNRLMRDTFKEALGDKDAYDKAAQFQKMGIDMQRIRSEAEGMAASMRQMDTVSKYSNNAWSESNAKIKSMSEALSNCADQARIYEAALREDPSNLTAAVGRLKALSNEYELSAAKSKELSQQVEAYKERLSGVLSEEKNLPAYIQRVGDEWQKAHTEIKEAEGKAEALRQSLQRLKDAQAPVEEIRQLEGVVDAADEKVKKLKNDAKTLDEAFETSKECAELQQLQAQLAETDAHAASLRKRMDMTSLGGKNFLNPSTIKSAGMTLYSTLTPAITMLGWRAITAAQDMDSAYRDMRKTVDGTETQFEELKQAAIDFSKTHVTSAEQILQIEAIGGELGIATTDLQAFAETVSNLDVATNLSTDEAASSLGKLANITHMTADEYDNYADALVRLGNNGASTEDQIVDIATRIGSMGTIVGMTVPDILALSSSIAATGMKTEAAGTAIANTMSDIESAVASGGESLDAFGAVTEHVGMSAEEFAQAWKDDPVVAFKAFIDGLNQIEAEGGSAVSTLEMMGITGERQKQSILGLMQTIGGLNDNLAMSHHAWEGQSDAWGAAGDAAREAQKKAEGFSGQISILSNIGKDAMASLAEGATPVIALLSDFAKGALDMFDGMGEGAKTATVLALGLGAVIGPLLTMASTFLIAKQNIKAFILESSAMGKAINIMKAGFVGTGMSADGMKTKLLSLGEAAKTIGKSIGKDLALAAVVVGVTMAVGAISDYVKKLREAEDAAKNAGDVIGTALGNAVAQNGQAISKMGMSYDEMVSKMAENNRKLQESANETYGNNELIEEYGEGLKAALDAYNEGDRSAEAMASLKTQLELYNAAAGTSISFTQDESGALHLMKDGAELSAGAFDKLTASMMNAAKAEFFKEAYTTKVGDYKNALDEVADAENRVKTAQEAMDAAVFEGDMDAARQYSDQLDAANSTLDKSKQKLAETKTAMDQYKEGLELMTEAQLENSSAAVQWVAENDEIQASIWASGHSVEDFAHNLAGLGVSYDDLESHADGVAKMASSWDGSIASMIGSLQEMGLEVDLSTAKLEGLNATEIDGKTYWVDDLGTVYDQQGKVIGLKKEIGGIEGKDFVVTDNGTASESSSNVRDLKGEISGVEGKDVSVSADVYGLSDVWSLSNAISNVRSKTVDIVANTFGSIFSATGSIADSPYIPRHASGYIAAGPTLTNNGWVGEAGAEAVLNWGTGGTVVPLTNERYMEPIAKAIAHNMGGQSTTNNVVYEINVTASGNGDDIARQITKAIRAQELMRGRR